jgi:hypothetical protein
MFFIAMSLFTTCMGISCQNTSPAPAPTPAADLEGGPVSEAEARRIAEESAGGLPGASPELRNAFVEKTVTLLAHRDAEARVSAAEDLGRLGRKAAAIPRS